MKIRRSSILKVFYFPCLFTFMLAIFLLTFSVNVSAASSSDTELPYLINYYNPIYNSAVNFDSSTYESIVTGTANYFSVSDYNSAVVTVKSYASRYNRVTFRIVFNPIINYNFGSDDAFHSFNITTTQMPYSGSQYDCTYDLNSGSIYSYGTASNTLNLFGNTSPYSFNGGTARGQYPVFLYGTDRLTDVSGNHNIVTNFVPVVVPDVGHAQDPSNNIPSFVPPIGMHPQAAPSVPTTTIPTATTAPTFDSSAPVQSVWDYIKWAFGFLFDLIRSLLQNIVDWFTFIGDLIVWLYEQMWNYVTFFIDWLYRIFEYLFSPIYNFLKALFHDGDNVISLADLLYNLYVRFDSFADTIFQDSWFTNFWDNFADDVEDVLSGFHNLVLFFDKLIELGTVNGEFTILNLVKTLFVPDTAQVTAALMGHDDFHFYDTGHAVVQKVDYIKTTLSTVTPEKRFYVPSTTYHGVSIGGFYIDFSWYDDYKLYGDLLISTFLTLGFVYWVCLNMSNFIRGQSSVGNDLHRLEK